jgi:hypothetical protein
LDQPLKLAGATFETYTCQVMIAGLEPPTPILGVNPINAVSNALAFAMSYIETPLKPGETIDWIL